MRILTGWSAAAVVAAALLKTWVCQANLLSEQKQSDDFHPLSTDVKERAKSDAESSVLNSSPWTRSFEVFPRGLKKAGAKIPYFLLLVVLVMHYLPRAPPSRPLPKEYGSPPVAPVEEEDRHENNLEPQRADENTHLDDSKPTETEENSPKQTGMEDRDAQQTGTKESGVQQSETEASGTQQAKIEESGMQQTEKEESGMQQAGTEESGVQKTRMEGRGIQRIGAERSGQKLTGTEETGLKPTETEEGGMQQTETEESGMKQTKTEESGMQQSETEESGIQQTDLEENSLQQAETEESSMQQIGTEGIGPKPTETEESGAKGPDDFDDLPSGDFTIEKESKEWDSYGLPPSELTIEEEELEEWDYLDENTIMENIGYFHQDFRLHQLTYGGRTGFYTAQCERQLKLLELSNSDREYLTDKELTKVDHAKAALLYLLEELELSSTKVNLLQETYNMVNEQKEELSRLTDEGHTEKDIKIGVRKLLKNSYTEQTSARSSLCNLRCTMMHMAPSAWQSGRALILTADRRSRGISFPHSVAAALSAAEHVLNHLPPDANSASSGLKEPSIVEAEPQQEEAIMAIVEEQMQRIAESSLDMQSLLHSLLNETNVSFPKPSAEALAQMTKADAVARYATTLIRQLMVIKLSASNAGIAGRLEAANLTLRRTIDKASSQINSLLLAGAAEGGAAALSSRTTQLTSTDGSQTADPQKQ